MEVLTWVCGKGAFSKGLVFLKKQVVESKQAGSNKDN